MSSANMEKIEQFILDASINVISFLVVTIIGCVLVRLIIMLIKKVISKSKIQHAAKTFILSCIKVALYFLVAITALATIGVNVASLLTALGAAALTAGLALQDNLKNLVSGLVILINKPFVSGDILEFEDMTGSVESINIFYTTLNTTDDKLARIPNSRLTSNSVVNCSLGDKRRMILKYTVSYEDDLAKVKEVLTKVASDCEFVLKEPEPSARIGKHLESGIEVVVKFWIEPHDYFEVYYYMQENVKTAFDKNGITIPYPHMVIKSEK